MESKFCGRVLVVVQLDKSKGSRASWTMEEFQSLMLTQRSAITSQITSRCGCAASDELHCSFQMPPRQFSWTWANADQVAMRLDSLIQSGSLPIAPHTACVCKTEAAPYCFPARTNSHCVQFETLRAQAPVMSCITPVTTQRSDLPGEVPRQT